MAQYATLIAAIQSAIKQNGNNEITGNLLQQALLSMISSLGAGYQYMGVATPSTNPGTPDQNVFYLASQPGTYGNFGSIVLASGDVAVLYFDGTWHKTLTGIASNSEIADLVLAVFGGIGQVGAYLDGQGNAVANENYGISVFIPVTPNTSYTWYLAGPSFNAAKIELYNNDKVLITYYSPSSSGSTFNSGNAAYVRASFYIGATGNRLETGGQIVWTPSESLQTKVDAAQVIAAKAIAENSYYNVTANVPLTSGYYTLETAIAAIPQSVRKKGLRIMFAFNAVGWSRYWFNGTNLNDATWNNTANWNREKSGLLCLTQNPVDFDLVNKKMKFSQYGTIPLIVIGDGRTVEIPRGTEIDITSSYYNYSIIYDAKSNTFSTASLGSTLYNEQFYFAHIVTGTVFAHPVVLNYTVNGNLPTMGNSAKGDVGYIANVEAAIFDFEAGTLTFPGFPDSTKVYANGRATTFANTSGLTIQLAGTNEEGVIVFDFADNTIKTYIRTQAYTAPATSVLLGWYNQVRKTAYLAGRFTIRGQHDYWDYSDLPTWLMDGISAHIQKVCQGVVTNDLVFDFITDVQTNGEYDGCRRVFTEAKNAGMQTPKFVVNGGDFVSGLATAADDIRQMSRMYAAHKRGTGGKDLFMCQGNHDGTWQKWNAMSGNNVTKDDVVTDKAWYNMFLKNIDGAVYDSANPMGGYLYKDYDDAKVRVIILNTVDVCVYQNGYLKYNPMYKDGIRQQQFDWLVNHALDFSDKGADKTNWGIIVFTHFGLDSDNDWFSNATIVEHVLQAFRTGSAINEASGTVGDDFRLTVDHDFSEQGPMNYIAYVHGHTHTDRVLFNNGVPHIATAAAHPDTEETPPVGATLPLPRTAGTLSEYCWDTMCLNKGGHEIVAYGFGAGHDRYIKLGANTISVGGTVTLTTKLSGTITWGIYAMNSANIAEITNGLVRGIAAGNATAYAQDENGNKEFFSIVVQ